MGEIQQPRPVLRLMAVFSRYPEALKWALDRAEAAWGKAALSSQAFRFDQTKYYERDMGPELVKQFHVFDALMDPAELPAAKIVTNDWEGEFARRRDLPESRPLNIDPGYLTEAKLILATTKDRDHRIYLADGIYAEGTLYFHAGNWRKRDWTYPDYQSPEYHEFFTKCRNHLRQQLRNG